MLWLTWDCPPGKLRVLVVDVVLVTILFPEKDVSLFYRNHYTLSLMLGQGLRLDVTTTGAGIPLCSFFPMVLVVVMDAGPLVGEAGLADLGTGMELRLAEVRGAFGGLGGGISGVVGLFKDPEFSLLKLFLSESSVFVVGLVGSLGIRDSLVLGANAGLAAVLGLSVSSVSSSSSSSSRNGLVDFLGTGGAGAANGFVDFGGVVALGFAGIWLGGVGAAKGLEDLEVCWTGGGGAANGLVDALGDGIIEGGGILLLGAVGASLVLGEAILDRGAGLGILLSFFFSKVGKSIIISPSSLLACDGVSLGLDRRGMLLPLFGGGGLAGTVGCVFGSCGLVGETDPEDEVEDIRGCLRPEKEEEGNLRVGLSDSESVDSTLDLGPREGESALSPSAVLPALVVLTVGCFVTLLGGGVKMNTSLLRLVNRA